MLFRIQKVLYEGIGIIEAIMLIVYEMAKTKKFYNKNYQFFIKEKKLKFFSATLHV